MLGREMKSRKAKFGWDLGSLHIGNVIEFADFYKAIQDRFGPDEYNLEESGWGGNGTIKLYTDIEEVATWIRQYMSSTPSLTFQL